MRVPAEGTAQSDMERSLRPSAEESPRAGKRVKQGPDVI